ncbi:MAG TPA: hypothetical protein VG125_00730 [Pirellulales bacterium]|nr:hypothetical protein [Pirellulales bacterium]
MKRVRRRLLVLAFNCVAVSAALVLFCGTLAFFLLTATAAQENRTTNPRTVSAISTGHAVRPWQEVPTGWQDNGRFAKDFVRRP